MLGIRLVIHLLPPIEYGNYTTTTSTYIQKNARRVTVEYSSRQCRSSSRKTNEKMVVVSTTIVKTSKVGRDLVAAGRSWRRRKYLRK